MDARTKLHPLVHASSLWSGMVFPRNEDDILEAWGQGCVELHYELAAIALRDFELCERLYEACPDGDWPGVYLYEVTEVLGDWLGGYLLANGCTPPEYVLGMQHRELALAFFPEDTRAIIAKEVYGDVLLDDNAPATDWPALYEKYHGEPA